MPNLNSISPGKLARLVGTPSCPTIIHLNGGTEALLPASSQRSAETVADWAGTLVGRQVVVADVDGQERSAGVAAYLRSEGINAEILEGGFGGWVDAGLPVVDGSKLPRRDSRGRTIWVTRSRPKVDRIACPWLIRRFVDPDAIFLFVAPASVAGVAERFGAGPFDADGVLWSDTADLCTFQLLVQQLGLSGFEALTKLGSIVGAADSGRPELAPQAHGLLAASLGLSRMHSDDLAQLADGMILYDAFYRWCRDASDETHDLVSHIPRRARTDNKAIRE